MNASVIAQQGVRQGSELVPLAPNLPPATPPKQTRTEERPPTPASETTDAAGSDDAAIQSKIERMLAADPTLSKLDVSTLVKDGKVTVVGSVSSAELKSRVEKPVCSVKGVVSVANQLWVTKPTPSYHRP